MKELDLIKSSNDKKDYKYLKLSNGIAVLLIHDPAVAEALAAEVGVAKFKRQLAAALQQSHILPLEAKSS